MPSDRSWIGGTSGDPGVAANYSGSTLPIDGDTLRFNQGSVSISTNEDALDEIDLVLMTRNAGYTGSWGDEDDYFTINADRLEYSRPEGILLDDYLAGVFDVIVIEDTGGKTLNLLITGDTRVEAKAGNVRIKGGSEYGDVHVGRAVVEIEATAVQASGKEIYFNKNGNVIAYGEIQNADGAAGILTLRGDDASLAGVARTGNMRLDIETVGAVNEVRNLVPNKQGVKTSKAHQGANIGTYVKHREAVDDFSGNDDGRVTVGTLIEIGAPNSLTDI